MALPEYSILRQDRRTSGEGVALYIHKSLSVTRLCSSTWEWAARPGLPEYLFYEVSSVSGPPIFVGVVYCPPHAPFIVGEQRGVSWPMYPLISKRTRHELPVLAVARQFKTAVSRRKIT